MERLRAAIVDGRLAEVAGAAACRALSADAAAMPAKPRQPVEELSCA